MILNELERIRLKEADELAFIKIIKKDFSIFIGDIINLQKDKKIRIFKDIFFKLISWRIIAANAKWIKCENIINKFFNHFYSYPEINENRTKWEKIEYSYDSEKNEYEDIAHWLYEYLAKMKRNDISKEVYNRYITDDIVSGIFKNFDDLHPEFIQLLLYHDLLNQICINYKFDIDKEQEITKINIDTNFYRMYFIITFKINKLINQEDKYIGLSFYNFLIVISKIIMEINIIEYPNKKKDIIRIIDIENLKNRTHLITNTQYITGIGKINSKENK